eukprot:3814169-Prymnesium_polylepis.1
MTGAKSVCRERASLPSFAEILLQCSDTCPRHAPARKKPADQAVRLFMRNSIIVIPSGTSGVRDADRSNQRSDVSISQLHELRPREQLIASHAGPCGCDGHC